MDSNSPNNTTLIKNLQSMIKKLQTANLELKTQNTQYRMEIAKLKDDLHLSKASHKRLTEKLEKRDTLITALYDLE